MATRSGFVVITSITRKVTTLGVDMPNATIHDRFGELVEHAGGVPIYADHHAAPAALADRVDAVVINGGGDVAPERYGAPRHGRTNGVQERRDEFEIELVRAAADRGVPVLGVCRGIQLVNVALGGTLVQHVPEAVGREHMCDDALDQRVHEVVLAPGSRLAALYGRDRLSVNSLHHQAVDRPGRGLRVTASAPDGTVEGIESEDGRILGVQWHPELLAEPAAWEHVPLFRWLLAARDEQMTARSRGA
jgi:gamma-glutamyl-gamma-aminobutyrate hydrolase PuuD